MDFSNGYNFLPFLNEKLKKFYIASIKFMAKLGDERSFFIFFSDTFLLFFSAELHLS